MWGGDAEMYEVGGAREGVIFDVGRGDGWMDEVDGEG